MYLFSEFLLLVAQENPKDEMMTKCKQTLLQFVFLNMREGLHAMDCLPRKSAAVES